MDINFVTPINTLSYGITGTNLIVELAKNHNVALFPIGNSECYSQEQSSVLRKCLDNCSFFNPDAPCIRLYHQFDMGMRAGRGFLWGFPIFELNRFNEVEKHHLRQCDKLLVCSEWAKQVIINNKIKSEYASSSPVSASIYVVPLGVDHEIFFPQENKNWSEGPTKFINIGKWEVRKGHYELLEAFNNAFEESDNVELTLHCYNPFIGEAGNNNWASLFKNSKLGNKINIVNINRFPGQNAIADLIREHDCGVFPAKAEGWNLPLLECMACGLHVITTDCTAHTQFVNAGNSHLIEMTSGMESAYDGVFFKGFGEWHAFGKSQKDVLVGMLREIHKDKQSGLLKQDLSGIMTGEQFTWHNSAEKLVEAISC